MADGNSFTLPDDDSSDLNTLLSPTIAASMATSSAAMELQEVSQLPQQPGSIMEILPGNGTGMFYGPEAREENFRRSIGAKYQVKKPMEQLEEGGGYHNKEDWSDYYLDEEGKWWYLGNSGQLFAEGCMWIVPHKSGYIMANDGRMSYWDIDGRWWVEHRAKKPAKETQAGVVSDINEKTLESNSEVSTGQGAENKKKMKKNNKLKESNFIVFQKQETPREDNAAPRALSLNDLLLVDYNGSRGGAHSHALSSDWVQAIS